MENDLDIQDEIIAEREKGIAEVQTNMLEINEMFRDLNTLVIEQAPLVDSIQSHIEHARFDVEQGVVEVEKASGHQKSAGSKLKMIVCLLIGIMIALIVVSALLVYVFN
jgi:t-SNARE complex subunit (syntaxin)